MHLMILTPYDGQYCHAPGQVLRSVAESTYRGELQAYLIGAMTHQASQRALIAEVPLDEALVERALLMSFAQAFPGLEQDPETLAEIREQHQAAADHPVGSVVRPTLGAYEIRRPDAASVAAAAALVERAAQGLRDLAEGRWNYSLRPEGWR